MSRALTNADSTRYRVSGKPKDEGLNGGERGEEASKRDERERWKTHSPTVGDTLRRDSEEAKKKK